MDDLTIAEALLQANTPQKLNRAKSRMLAHIAEKQTGLGIKKQRVVEKRCLAAFRASVRRLPDCNLDTNSLNELVAV